MRIVLLAALCAGAVPLLAGCGSQDPLGNSCPGGKQWFQPGNANNGCDAHH